MNVPLIVSAIVFFMLLGGGFAVYLIAENRRGSKTLRNRIERAGMRAEAEDEADAAVKGGIEYFSERAGAMFESIGKIAQPKKESDVSGLRRKLTTAAFRSQNAPTIFVGMKLLLAVLFPIVLFFLPIPEVVDAPALKKLLIFLGIGVAGMYTPELVLGQFVKRRQLKITNSFPDSLDLLVVCVEAGLGLDAAISRSSRELGLAHPELSDEFMVLRLELRAGLPRAQALQNLADRIDLDSVRSFAALLIQTDRFGTSVAQALRVYSDAMRIERSQRAEETAAKLPVKLLLPLMLFIFPCLFIVILGPAVIQGVRILLPTLNGTN